ncbi:BA14K family protein [Mesorhizobium yinganensis]|uniref:BA14K family protein n=1 Tax=Mesorhizobium yinganensis TaxID=3157707 RepID=UPI003CCD2638
MDHTRWCTEHYRSYSAVENSYTSYKGVQRNCVSPFSEGTNRTDQARVAHPEAVIGRADVGLSATVDARHKALCLARYQSYNSQDNSYQPYGGGPRRQCR